MSGKLRVGILGATGTVGQWFVRLLEDHPQFEITALAGSERSQGKQYAEACTWRFASEMPIAVGSLVVQSPEPPLDCDLIFSSLPSSIAREVEAAFVKAGYPVISNSSSFRMETNVPLLIPEVNPDQLTLLDAQLNGGTGGQGFIVTNPNCSTIVLACAGINRHGVADERAVQERSSEPS
jgi:aspartate-semialdehyde dehydrogenase